MKYFTVAEAEALIPELEAIYEQVLALAKKASLKASIIQNLDRDPKHAADAAIERSRLQVVGRQLNEQLHKIADLGAMPKGLEPALVDFPHRLGGREVYLCWQLGEKSITHYHGLDEGFGGRKPLPGATRD